MSNLITHLSILTLRFSVEIKFSVGDHLQVSKYQNILAKAYQPILTEEMFLIKKDKNTTPWTFVFEDLHGKEIAGTF